MAGESERGGSVALAAVTVLGAIPLTFGLLSTLHHVGYASGELPRQFFSDGGSWSFAIAGAGGLGIVLAALVMAASVRRAWVPAPLALAPLFLPWLVALTGIALTLSTAREAIDQGSRSARSLLLLGEIAEASTLRHFAFAVSSAGALAVALACLIAFRGAGRVVTGLASAALGLSLAAGMQQSLAYWSSCFSFLQEDLETADVAALVAPGVERYLRFGHAADGLLLFGLLVTAVGGAVLGIRRSRGIAVSVGAPLLACLLGFRGLVALAERELTGGPLARPPAAIALDFDGPRPPRHWESFDAEDDAEIDRTMMIGAKNQLCSWGGQASTGALISQSLSSAGLLRILQDTHSLGLGRLDLVGAKARKLEVPPAFGALADAASRVPRASEVAVIFTGEPCDACVGSARWTAEGLAVTPVTGEVETWLPSTPTDFAKDLQHLEFDGTAPLVPMDLVRASLTALAKGHLLVVRVPPPRNPPVLPGPP